MANTNQPALSTPVEAAAALSKCRFIGFNGNYASAGAKALGVTNSPFDLGEIASVDVLGVLLVEAGAAITNGAEVEVGIDGKAIPKTSGAGNGFAFDAASGIGEFIRIVRGI